MTAVCRGTALPAGSAFGPGSAAVRFQGRCKCGASGRAEQPPESCQPPSQEPQREPFLTAFASPRTCPRLCEHARPRQRTGYRRRPRSHTHNPRVTGDTKEVPRRWEPGRGQEGQPGRAGPAATASFLSHRGRPSVFSLLIPPFNPLLLSAPGSRRLLVSRLLPRRLHPGCRR